jgi:phenylalanyl-tRNA synthetase beta chain
MRIPYDWLKEYVPTSLPAQDMADLLTRQGLEVEELVEASGEAVFDIKVTPNRGDCLSVVGVAREAAAALGLSRRRTPPKLTESGTSASDLATVVIEAPELCPRYSARIVTGAKIEPAPEWAQRRLIECGLRPINNVVDATNLVMFEVGQPLHAFDYHLVRPPAGDSRPRIVVRTARAGEKLVTLDGEERALTAEMLVIADPERAVALAGVMGGGSTEVHEGTTAVLLESAHFDRISIRRTAKALGLSTEASYRFERIVDPGGTIAALDRACELIVAWAGGEIAPGVVDEYPRPIAPNRISLRPARVNEILGTALTAAEMADYLRALDLDVAVGETLEVTAPTFRPDLATEIDLIEEIARRHGYENIPVTLPRTPGAPGKLVPALAFDARVRRVMLACGLSEVVTYSLGSRREHDLLGLPPDHPLRQAVVLQNPKTEEYSQLRTTMLGDMLGVLANNARRGITDVQVFEVGKVYFPQGPEELAREPRRLGIGMMGSAWSSAWGLPAAAQAVDFYSLKGAIEQLVYALTGQAFAYSPDEHPSLQPGRTATVSVSGEEIGILGEVSRAVRDNYELPLPAYVAEIDLDRLRPLTEGVRSAKAVSRFPGIRRDVALVVAEATSAARVQEAIARHAGEHLEALWLFDLYRGDPIPAGHKNLAYAMVFRALDRTLTDEEVDRALGEIKSALVAELGAQIRE